MSPRFPEWVKKAMNLYRPYLNGTSLADDAPDEVKKAFSDVDNWLDDYYTKESM